MEAAVSDHEYDSGESTDEKNVLLASKNPSREAGEGSVVVENADYKPPMAEPG